MRPIRLLVALMLVFGLVNAVPAASGADMATVDVPVQVFGGADEPLDPERCEGFAPTEFFCTKSWELKDNFTFVISLAHDFVGTVTIHGWTPTGTVTATCPWFMTECIYEHGGFFMEGQQFTMVVKATGAGFWRVTVR